MRDREASSKPPDSGIFLMDVERADSIITMMAAPSLRMGRGFLMRRASATAGPDPFYFPHTVHSGKKEVEENKKERGKKKSMDASEEQSEVRACAAC